MLQSILGQLSPLIQNSGVTPGEQSAIGQLQASAAQGNPGAAQMQTNATSLLNGGGAQNNDGLINSAYQTYAGQVSPMASNMNYDPTTTPGMQALLQTIRGDVGNSVNSQFAAAGRDMSGMNQQTLARGISQGEAAPLLAQYNQNIQNQQGAAQNLYNAGQGTAGALNTTQAAANANTQAGTTAQNDAITARNYGANTSLSLEQLMQSIPAQNLGLLAQIGIPIAGLGSQSSGSSQGTSTMSGAQQFATIAQGIGNLIPKGPMKFNF